MLPESPRWASPRPNPETPFSPGQRQIKENAMNRKVLEQQRKDKVKQLLLRTLGGDEERKHKPWMLPPDSSARIIVSAFSLAASVYVIFAQPFLAAFDIRPAPVSVVVVSTIADLIFAVDIVCNCITGYWWLAEDGVWKVEMRPQRTLYRYLTAWFWVDILTAVPTQLVLSIFDPSGLMAYPGPTLIRVLELVKCLRLIRVFRTLQRAQDRTATHFGSLTIAKALAVPVIFCHWMACAWFWVANESHRVQQTFPEDPEVCSARAKLLFADTADQYVCALYWAVQTMTTVGYGDIPPFSVGERAFVIFGMMLGVAVLIWVVVVAGSLADASRRHHRWFQAEVSSMMSYMHVRRLPQDIVNDTRSYYDYRWKSCQGYDDLERIRRLPVSLRIRVFHTITQSIANAVNFLAIRGLADTAFWTVVLEELEQQTYLPGAYLEREGVPPDRIVIVKEGEVQVFHESSGYVFEVCRKGSWFGGNSDISARGATASARASSNVTTYEISEGGIRRIMKLFPDSAHIIRDTYKWRLRRNGAARWRIAWMKHKATILQMAAMIKRPAPPWPAPSVGKRLAPLDARPHRERTKGEEPADMILPGMVTMTA